MSRFNDAVIIQHAYTEHDCFVDMARLTYQRHAAYANSHGMDYWHFIGNTLSDKSFYRGGWVKLDLMRRALEAGYQHIFWVDADAAIINMDCDLRDALPQNSVIGAVLHDPAKSPYLKQHNIPAHLNVGVLYANAGVKPMLAEWLSHYDGPLGRFLEQGVFNEMYEAGAFGIAKLDDTWNSTVNVNLIERPNVLGWHGVFPVARRLAMMQATLVNDFLTFRV